MNDKPTLEEIYSQPSHYFDSYVLNHNHSLGIVYTRYAGANLRENGTKIFTIKEDDRWSTMEGGHSAYCEICNEELDESFWRYCNRLGPYWFEDHTEYVRPHP